MLADRTATPRPVAVGPALLPGAIGISRLRVYDTPAIDEVVGGTPHVHLVCSEGYYVVGGHGAVDTLTSEGERRIDLHAGVVAWFTPGTVHRLTNHDGLDIVCLMQNSGLPEKGNAVLTLPRQILADPDGYRAAAVLGPDATLADAFRRRDLAVEGLQELLADLAEDGPVALERFYESATVIVGPRLAGWRTLWRDGAARAAQTTGEQLDRLESGQVAHLFDAAPHACPTPVETGRLGMCGLLETYPSLTHED
jgi:mannose-6-phosphate isomerase-like protein (cupin superfamily)